MAGVKEKGPPKLSLIENLALSGAAAVASKTATAPLVRIQLLLQCQGEMVRQGTFDRPYSGIIDCIRHTYRNESLMSFWRGNLVSCIRYFPTQALNLAFKDRIKTIFAGNRNDPYMKNFAKNVASGGVAGAITLSFVYSLDYAHTRLVTDVKSPKNGVSERKFNGLVDVYRKTWAADGIAGFYRGFVISCAAIFVYRGCYFGLYDTLKPILLGPDAGFIVSLVLGYGVTITSGIISYPLDTIRHRMMMTSGETVKYKGALNCMFQIIRNEGSTALFKGLDFALIRGIGGAVLLAGFDKLVILYTGVKVDKDNRG